MRRILLFTSTYLFPIAGFPLLAWAWWRVGGGQWRLVALVLGVPLIFGYLIPGAATNMLRRWQFTGPWRIGNYYLHHGFVYASKMSLVLLLAFHRPSAIRTWYASLAAIVLVAAATAFGGWWHDTWAIRTGKVALLSEPNPRDAEYRLATFAPPDYFAIGATYSAATILGWRSVQNDPHTFVWIFPAALVALCVIPTIVHFSLDPEARRVLTPLPRE
jgi:hypothetical protein